MKHNYIIKAVGDDGTLQSIGELKGISDEGLQTYCESEGPWTPPWEDLGTITLSYSVDPELWEELRIEIASHISSLRNIYKTRNRKKQRLKRKRK